MGAGYLREFIGGGGGSGAGVGVGGGRGVGRDGGALCVPVPAPLGLPVPALGPPSKNWHSQTGIYHFSLTSEIRHNFANG